MQQSFQKDKDMSLNSFRDLRVWQAGMDLVIEVYGLTKGFPREKMYGLTSQLRRAAISVPSNIAEGHARVEQGVSQSSVDCPGITRRITNTDCDCDAA
jgi:hypothetical protein